ncbi:MAG: hypothetical protein KGJ80_10640 [Chloroflexota bacterium]|nr:hypothetical protein [Chloroflexota bacterium]
MKRLLAFAFAMIVFSGGACGTPFDPAFSRDQNARGFATAFLSGNTPEVKKYLENPLPGETERLLGIYADQVSKLEFTNVAFTSESYGPPTAAQRANGIEDRYRYMAKFASRGRDAKQSWQDGCLIFSLVLKNTKWVIVYIDTFSVDGLSAECQVF